MTCVTFSQAFEFYQVLSSTDRLFEPTLIYQSYGFRHLKLKTSASITIEEELKWHK